jgi:hypothetical protein
MTRSQPSSRRRILEWCLAAAVAIAPAMVWVGITTSPAPRAVADTQCADGLSMDPVTMECLPVVAPTGTSTASSDFSPAPDFISAPSEMEVTESNPGMASPSHGGR